uniref:Uncharacterized protein n=1 Tax=Anguilla anguilla TaxID=7936 RepID=A0A0E9W391_ANGAN
MPVLQRWLISLNSVCDFIVCCMLSSK